MRLLHTSDWHLGRRLHGEDLLAHQAHFLDWLVELAQAEQVGAVLVSGDVYDRAQPGADAVRLMDRTLAAFVRAGIALVISSGNHDSAVRLQYAGDVLSATGIHLRTELGQVLDPVLLSDDAGPVGVYAIPFLLPDAVTTELAVERSHAEVLGHLARRIREDAAQRGLERVVVMAHAFVTGGSATESEREIRVGGVGDTPASVFDGLTYVALGHLHRPQRISLAGSATRLSYSGSPLAFSFSEREHVTSVSIVDIDALGGVSVRRVPTPVPRPLVQVSGRLDELLARAEGDLARLAQAWVKVVLTDPGRVPNPMDRLRQVWPHTLVLEFAPERDGAPSAGPRRYTEASDPVQICADFVAEVSGAQASEVQRELLAQAVHAATTAEAVS
ncbi:MAG: exonuclease SbcCD subunit D [Candidatus Nanopelagicales bacterium]